MTATTPDAAPNSILVLYVPLLTMAGAYTLPAVIKLPPVMLPLAVTALDVLSNVKAALPANMSPSLN